MKSLQVIFLLVMNILIVECQHFSIIAPAIIRSNETYKVATTYYSDDVDDTLAVKLGVKGVSQKGQHVEAFKTISVNSSRTRTTKFRVKIVQFMQ